MESLSCRDSVKGGIGDWTASSCYRQLIRQASSVSSFDPDVDSLMGFRHPKIIFI